MSRGGFALVFVLLVVGAVELLALATLALATHEAVAVHAEQRTIAARRAAETALRRFARAWPHASLGQLAIGGSTRLTDASGVRLTVQRHGWGLYEAMAAAPTGNSFVREALVLRTLDLPRALQDAALAMLAVGAPADTLTCTLPAHHAGGTRSHSADHALGGVRWDEVASIADTIVAGVTSLTATDTLGTPIIRIVYSAVDLSVVAGLGAGILLVDGDLDIGSGVDFTGIVVARGRVTLAQHARITGSVWAQQPGGALIGGAGLVHSPCWCARVLQQAPGAGRLISAQRRFIPAF